MGFNVGDKISAEDFENIKSRVYAECDRRGITYTTGTAVSNEKAMAIQGASIINTLNQINADKIQRDDIASGSILQNWATVTSALTEFEAGTNSDSGCKNGCMGLCQAACSNNCGDSCSQNCASSCSTSCSGCSGSCSGSCSGGCSSGCGGSCGGCGGCSGCSGGCSGSCSGNCGQACGNCSYLAG